VRSTRGRAEREAPQRIANESAWTPALDQSAGRGSAGDIASESRRAGRFYSRARNRYSQWGGHDLWPSSATGSTSAFGARSTGDYPEEFGPGHGASYRETPGFGYPSTIEREIRARPLVERGRGQRAPELTERDIPRAFGVEAEIAEQRVDIAPGIRRGGEWEGGRGEGLEREMRRSRWRREPLAAREIMTRNPLAAHLDSSMIDVARIMRDENTGIVPIVDDDGRLLGVVTDRDIVMRSIAEGTDPLAMRAGDLMSIEIEAATPDESVRDVVRLMGDRQVRRVPVVDQDDTLVGIISMADVATRADYDTDLQDALEEISSRRSFWGGVW
jgi:CBS domain-containing protein